MPWPAKTQAVAIRAGSYSWEVSEAAFIEGPP